MSRESELTDEITDVICADLAEGYTIAVAYGNAGISKEQFYYWLERGKEENPEPKYYAFYARIESAKFAGRKKLEKRVVNAKDPKVALTVLSRLYRDDWGEKINVDVEGNMAHNVTFASKDDIEKL